MLVEVAILAIAARAVAVPQGVTTAIAPTHSPPPGCSPNYDGSFVMGPVNVSTSKRDLDERSDQQGIRLKDGFLKDPLGRTGYVAANFQFQFDDLPKAGAVYTAGFTVCQNLTLALGDTAIWYKCLSGNFFNLYYKSIGGQCIQSFLVTSALSNSGGPVPLSASSSIGSSKAHKTISTTTTGTSGTHTSTPSIAHTSTSPSTTSETATSKGGLSSGAKIGVGVGVGVGVGCLLLALASFLFLRRRLRRRYQDSPSPIAQHNSDKPDTGELAAKAKSHELAAGRGQLPELAVKEKPQELPTERY